MAARFLQNKLNLLSTILLSALRIYLNFELSETKMKEIPARSHYWWRQKANRDKPATSLQPGKISTFLFPSLPPSLCRLSTRQFFFDSFNEKERETEMGVTSPTILTSSKYSNNYLHIEVKERILLTSDMFEETSSGLVIPDCWIEFDEKNWAELNWAEPLTACHINFHK